MTKNKEFIRLGWELLEHKYRYYVQNSATVSDREFDKLEKRYRILAKKLRLRPTAVDMVDFNWSRPSCRLAAFRVHGVDPRSGDYRLSEQGHLYKYVKGKLIRQNS